MRFIHCDTVIFLDYSFDVCMNGIMDRVGKERADIPWTEKKLDPELVKLVEEYSNKKQFVFRTRDEADVWIELTE